MLNVSIKKMKKQNKKCNHNKEYLIITCKCGETISLEICSICHYKKLGKILERKQVKYTQKDEEINKNTIK